MKTIKTYTLYCNSMLLKNSIPTWLVKTFLLADYYFLAQMCCFIGCPKPKHLMSSLQPPWTPLSFAPHVPLLVLTHLSFHTAGHSLSLYLILPTPHLSMHCTKLFRNNFLAQVLVMLCFT